ncbi:MAG: hypothetical protein GY856_42025 [bacterium]|nr:hypothetical protein [bacterium]
MNKVMIAMKLFDRTEVLVSDFEEFETDLVSARTTWSLSPRVFFRALLQWRQDDNFDAKLLFRWIYKPGAAFYVAYDELRNLREHHPVDFSSSRDRSLIVKMSFYY